MDYSDLSILDLKFYWGLLAFIFSRSFSNWIIIGNKKRDISPGYSIKQKSLGINGLLRAATCAAIIHLFSGFCDVHENISDHFCD